MYIKRITRSVFFSYTNAVYDDVTEMVFRYANDQWWRNKACDETMFFRSANTPCNDVELKKRATTDAIIKLLFRFRSSS